MAQRAGRVYVFSGDGKHGNPERETFEMLATARGKSARYDVHLAYTVASTDKLRKADAVSKKKTALSCGRASRAG